MKIAIASETKDIKSQVSPVAGRTPYYLIFEDEKMIKAIKNPFRMGGGGAGFGVADMMKEEGVEFLVSGSIGDNMKGALEGSGIEYREISDKSVEDVLGEINS